MLASCVDFTFLTLMRLLKAWDSTGTGLKTGNLLVCRCSELQLLRRLMFLGSLALDGVG